MFIGSYASAEEEGIHLALLAEPGDDIRIVRSHAGVANPSFLRVAPQTACLYAVSETVADTDGTAGHVHAFRLAGDGAATRLEANGVQPSHGDAPCHLALDPSEQWLAVSNYGTGSVAVLPIGSRGRLGDVAALAQHEGAGSNPQRQNGPHAHCSVFMPGGRFLVAADLGADALFVHAFDRRAGTLRPHRVVRSPAGAGPRHLALDPTGDHLFVVEELANRVAAYRWDASSGDLSLVAAVSSVPPDADESIAADLHMLPGGRHLYASNRGDDSVAVIGFDGAAGLEQLAVRPVRGAWPRGMALTPSGSRLLIANQHSNEVVVRPIVDGGADIGPPVSGARVQRPTCISIRRG